jgi:Kelch motif/Galactose oxidase, central domain
VPRINNSATLLANGLVLVVGGFDETAGMPTASAELYDPASETWRLTGSMTTPRSEHTATPLPNGLVLVTGGFAPTDAPEFLASAELYDPTTEKWRVTASMDRGRAAHTATLLPNGLVLVVGGSAELYDPRTETWRPIGTITHARFGHTATLLPDGRVLVAGASPLLTPDASESAELYDPATDTWRLAVEPPRSLEGQSATLLPNGLVLVAGGLQGGDSGSSEDFAAASLYDPVGDTWRETSSMSAARSFHTATMLSDGRVLIVSGSAELYDPETETWHDAGVPIVSRRGHTATVLQSGLVLIAGGYADGQHNMPLPVVELFDPSAALSLAVGR